MIEKVNPAELGNCILNIAISEKKAQGSICMNIDARPYNKGAKRTRYHVTTPQEARHKMKGAKIYSEFDKGSGFHQVPLAAASQVIFQSHLGLHRIKRMFFGPTNSLGIFHHARGRGGQHDAVQGKGRAPERWERWECVPSQFRILAATFG